MTKKEFKEKLFSYCQSLGYIITEHAVDFKLYGQSFGTLFYFSPYDGTFHYTPIPPNGEATSIRRIKINYNEEALKICKYIAKEWYMIYKERKIKEKVEEINKDFLNE